MNELQLKTTEMFGEVQTDIYENESHEMFMTIEQLGRCLGYSNGRKGVDNLIFRNKYLKEAKYSVPLAMRATNDKVTTLDTYYVNFINDCISELRKGKMVYVFKLSHIWEILKYVDNIKAIYQDDGIIGLVCKDINKSKNNIKE